MSQLLSQNDKSKLNWGVHWFRRDLRVAGNEGLRTNWKKTDGNTLGFFCFDSTFLCRADFSSNRFAFFLKTLKALKDELQSQGGDLLIVDSPPLQAFTQLLKYCDKAGIKRPSTVSYNRDYEPFAISRDQSVTNFLQSQEIDVSTHRDHLLFEPYEVLKSEKIIIAGTEIDCWVLNYNLAKPNDYQKFWISKKSHELLKEEDVFGYFYRYKLKLLVDEKM